MVLQLPAAAERVAYEQFLRDWEQSAIPVQTLLFPLSIELDPVRAEVLAAHLDFFHSIGLEIEPFGRNFFRLRTAPQAFAPEAAKAFLTDLVGLIAERGLRPGQENTIRETVAQLAAQRLARVSEKWDTPRIERLAEELLACQNPLADSRGRPTFFELSRREWEKRLGL